MSSQGFQQHDHDHCVSGTMETAVDLCAKQGLKFTPVRQRVLEILLQEHRALGAYDILAILGQEGLGNQPPVVYRALEFLGRHGFVHKIERLNAYVACGNPGTEHSPAFMICRTCDKIVETETRPSAGLSSTAEELGFEIEAMVVEVEGVCPRCQVPAA